MFSLYYFFFLIRRFFLDEKMHSYTKLWTRKEVGRSSLFSSTKNICLGDWP